MWLSEILFISEKRTTVLVKFCMVQNLSAMGGATPGGGSFGPIMSPRISSPMHPGGGRGGQTPSRAGGRGGGRGGHNIRRDRDLIGATIKITGGPFKGMKRGV